MQLNRIPRIGTRYWMALILASIFGANTGDFFSDVLGVGHFAGLPILAALFALIVAAEKRVSKESQFFFWAAIIIIRTAATNMGDIGRDLHVAWSPVLTTWAVMFPNKVVM